MTIPNVGSDLAFSPRYALPKGQLPTKSDVIEMLLNEKNGHTLEKAFQIAEGCHRYKNA